MRLARSPLDEARFGVRCAQASGVTEAAVGRLLAFCRSEQVDLCIARCDAADLPAAQALERVGFALMDTLVRHEHDLTLTGAAEHPGHLTLSLAGPEAAGEVAEVAALAFRDYGGHYHADPRIDPAQADEVYVSWAHRSCTDPAAADAVLVAMLDGRLAGFVTVRLDAHGDAEGLLDAVHPAARGRGVFRALLQERLRWSREQGARRATVSTQLTNLAAQRAWAKAGYLPLDARYTLHRWFSSA